jgi:hypothetical protein
VDEASIVREVAAKRNAHFVNKATNRPLGRNYEETGMWGEWEFGKWCGLMPRLEAGGDGGYDFLLPVRLRVDVKASRRGDALLVEAGKVKADVYVLAKVEEDEKWQTEQQGQGESMTSISAVSTATTLGSTVVTLLGWTWGADLLAIPPRDTGKGVVNHRVLARDLRPMEELKKMLVATPR